MKLFRLFSVALLASTCLQVNAARIVGVGTSTCASYTKAIGTPTEAWYTSWAFGFISATNTTSSPDFLKDKDGDAILAALKLACESHPPERQITSSSSSKASPQLILLPRLYRSQATNSYPNS
jgi:hypothetical protein